MYIHVTAPLFPWEALEDSPSLKTLKQLLASVPDGRLLESLRQARGKGRDDYPVAVLWGVLLLTIALRHTGIEACLGELGRNAGLRALLGIDSEAKVPRKWNMSRFLEVLGSEPHRTLLREVFDAMVGRLGGGWRTSESTRRATRRRSTRGGPRAPRDNGGTRSRDCP